MVFRIKRSKQVKYRLVTFADGGPLWDRTLKRLVREAKKSGYFSGVDVYNLAKIKETLPEFYTKNGHFIENNPRGFGYWIWKPAIVRRSLQNLRPNDAGIVYIDAGCSINPSSPARARFGEYLKMAEASGSLFFQLREHKNRTWTKIDLQNALNLCDEILESNQVLGTMFLLSKASKTSVDLLNEWQELAERDSYHLLDDSASRIPEEKTFREHRHDQALLSCLVHLHGYTAIPDESWFDNGWSGEAYNFPIWATRTKSGVSLFATGPYWYLIRHWENLKDKFEKSDSKNIISFYFRNR